MAFDLIATKILGKVSQYRIAKSNWITLPGMEETSSVDRVMGFPPEIPD